MFGISPLGWIHTLGSLPAIPAAAWMIARHGRIVPRSRAGLVYFAAMLVGAGSLFLFAHAPVSYGIAVATLVLLIAGYAAGSLPFLGRAAAYLETILLSVTVFLLMAPTVSETLRRVPDGHPLVADVRSPVLAATQGVLLVGLVIGVIAQVVHLRRRTRAEV